MFVRFSPDILYLPPVPTQLEYYRGIPTTRKASYLLANYLSAELIFRRKSVPILHLLLLPSHLKSSSKMIIENIKPGFLFNLLYIYCILYRLRKYNFV